MVCLVSHFVLNLNFLILNPLSIKDQNDGIVVIYILIGLFSVNFSGFSAWLIFLLINCIKMC